MKGKFLSFLIICLSLTAFLAGYIMVKRGVSSGSKTGTILDKFNFRSADQQQKTPDKSDLTLLIDKRVTFVTNSSDKDNVLYYEKGTGRILEMSVTDQTEHTIADKTFSDITSVVWSPNKKEVLSFLNPPSGPSLKYYNLVTSRSTDLGPNILSAAFSPDGNLIAYYYFDEDSQSGKIVIAQPDGLYQKKILNTRLKNVEISWPTKNNIALKAGSAIYFLTEDGDLTKLVEGALGFEEKWSPSGKKLIFSVFSGDINDSELDLWLRDELGNETTANIPGSAHLCTWSVDDIHIYCAIPDTSSADAIYKINTRDWSYGIIAEPNILVKGLVLSNLEDRLMIIGTADEKLYSIKISD